MCTSLRVCVCLSVRLSVCLCAFERNVCRHPCLEGCAHMGLSVSAGCVCLRAECVYSCVDMFEVTTHTHPAVRVVRVCVYLCGCLRHALYMCVSEGCPCEFVSGLGPGMQNGCVLSVHTCADVRVCVTTEVGVPG